MSPRPASGPDETQWEFHRPELTRLYSSENQPLSAVKKHMEDNYGFSAKPNQYHKYLVTKWGLRKNADSEIWQAIYAKAHEFKQEKVPYTVVIRGREIPAAKVRKEINRYKVVKRGRSNLAAPVELPSSVLVHGVSPARVLPFTVELPFHNFEGSLESHQLPTTQSLDIDLCGVLSELKIICDYPRSWSSPKKMMEAIQTMMPAKLHSNGDSDFQLMNPMTRLFASPMNRAILFSLANNFPGPEVMFDFIEEAIYRYDIGDLLCQMLHYMPLSYTSQAIANGLFKASLRNSDTRLLKSLLKSPVFSIDVNQVNFSGFWTPIGYAANGLDEEITRTLLDHGADVNLCNSDNPPESTLDCLINGWNYHQRHAQREFYEEFEHYSKMVTILIDAGAKILSESSLEKLAKEPQNGRYIRQILERGAVSNFKCWSDSDAFRNVFLYQDHETCLQLIATIQVSGLTVSENFCSYCSDNFSDPYLSYVDILTSRGNISLVEVLLNNGAKITLNTLSQAIISGNEAVVQLILDHRLQAGQQDKPPLAEAISTKNPRIIDLVVNHYGLANVDKRGSIELVVSEGGEAHSLECLLDVLDRTNPVNMEVLCMLALENQRHGLALELIDTAVVPVSANVLISTLNYRNRVILYSIIDFHIALEGIDLEDAVVLAAEWGDMQILTDIAQIYVDYDIEFMKAFCHAIKRKDMAIINLFLELGIDINQRKEFDDLTPLNVAVCTGDIDLVDHILSHGADPHDLKAIEGAMGDKRLFELLMCKHASRYPNGRRNWGPRLMNKAIDHGAYDDFKRLLERGANPSAFQSDSTTFSYAIEESERSGCKYVELLLQQREKTCCSPETVVRYSYSYKDGSLRRQILSVETAFEVAIKTSHRPTIELFLRYGAKVNYPAQRGIRRTPLQAAIEKVDIDIIKLLLSLGADVNGSAAYRGGATALQLAAISGNIPLVQMLMERGADIHAPAAQIDGRMPLEGAAEHGRLDMVVFLLAAGAGHKGEDKEQFDRAISFANKGGYSYIADMLTRYLEDGVVHMMPKFPFEEFIDFDGMVEV